MKDNGLATGMRLQFEEWFEEEEGYLLPKVWVKVYRLRKKLREYLTLWAVGSLLGATQMVDMKTTRKNTFGRIFMAVLSPKLVPRRVDVVIGDHYFELEFELEKKGYDESGDEVEIEQGGDGGDDKEDGGQEEDELREKETKRVKSDDMVLDDKEEGKMEGNFGGDNGNQGMDGVQEKFFGEMASKIIDGAVVSLLEEVCDKVMHEEGQPAVHEGEIGQREVEGGDDIEQGDGEEEVGKMIEEKIVRAAMVKEVATTPTRASVRLASSGEHSVEKATKRKARKNLEPQSGNDVNGSFLSLSCPSIIDNLCNIGINLGSSSAEILGSIVSLKNVEETRLRNYVAPKADLVGNLEGELESEEDEMVDNLVLGHLCGGLVDEVMDEEPDHLSCDLKKGFKVYKSKSSLKRNKGQKVKVILKNKKSMS